MSAVASPTREKMLVGGEWVESADGRTFDVETPAKRGLVIAQVPRSTAVDVDRAVKAAAAAFPAWRAPPPRPPGGCCRRGAAPPPAAGRRPARAAPPPNREHHPDR